MGTVDSPLFDAEAFADRYRGSEEEIRTRLRCYLRFLRRSDRILLDFGCGRGELLDLAREAGLQARGVEQSRSLVERCRQKGHEVALGDGFEALQAAPEASLGALVAIQVVEHLSLPQLERLLQLAAAKLDREGTLLLETPNPYNHEARRHFWLDPTHLRPLHPELLDFLAERAGFPRREIHYSGEDEYLQRLERRRRRTLWERVLGRRATRQPIPATERLLRIGEGSRFPDYALVAWR